MSRRENGLKDSKGHFQDNRDTQQVWQGIQVIMNYETTSPTHNFYARFEVQNNMAARKITPPLIDQVLCPTTAEVRKTLCRVNPWKSAGPENIPGRVLWKCAEQLADVFTDIFNISLSSAVVPTCLKKISAFNTIISQHLIETLSLLGLNTSLCNWILDFLTGRPQSVRIGNSISSTTTLSTGAPQGCVLSPLLFTLLTHDCVAMHSSNHIVKFADDTTVVGLISKNDESAYREEVQRRGQSGQSTLIIDGSSVEIVKSTKFLGVHLADNLTWSLNTSSITKKAQQRLYFLRRLRKTHLPPPILSMFYRGTIESILSSCITAWFGNCTVSKRKTLQRILEVLGLSLPLCQWIFNFLTNRPQAVQVLKTFYTCTIESVPTGRGLPANKQTLSRWIGDAITLSYESYGLPTPFGVKSKFEVLFGKLGRHIIWTKEEQDNPSCYQRSVQKPASLMVWGCMSACGMGSLHIWKGTINAERGLFDSLVQRYHRCRQKVSAPFLPRCPLVPAPQPHSQLYRWTAALSPACSSDFIVSKSSPNVRSKACSSALKTSVIPDLKKDSSSDFNDSISALEAAYGTMGPSHRVEAATVAPGCSCD
ncbi:gastrula zinc finger protein XlCGF28.1-like [Silurus meridionalis]|nr:gastrula zinc finger protein XlCGF28.1-like [Silurus meridionalis]